MGPFATRKSQQFLHFVGLNPTPKLTTSCNIRLLPPTHGVGHGRAGEGRAGQGMRGGRGGRGGQVQCRGREARDLGGEGGNRRGGQSKEGGEARGWKGRRREGEGRAGQGSGGEGRGWKGRGGKEMSR